ncbi:hypothetical protein IAR55_001454 [Kwoniella newhampshirensis]|uniref:Wax synthase domain-containing protein n=1 Tax=Kwoniella newhampshirensis TaxID=1651941 RepID=A0AAW0Z269_9TREE
MVLLFSTAAWLLRNVQYVIAALFALSTLIFSLAAYRIIRWILPSFSLDPFAKSPSIDRGKNPRQKPTTTVSSRRKRGDIKPCLKEKRVMTRSNARRSKGKFVWWNGICTTLLSTLSTELILCSISSAFLCAISLTSRGCESLRDTGLIEWLPWKEGLRCYKTRWDWVPDILGELIWTVLQGHEYGNVPLKSM